MPAPSFLFWQRWLFYSSIAFAVAAIVFAFYGSTVLFSPYHHLLAEVFWHQPEIPPTVEPLLNFMYKPIGGTIACCYILLAFIARYPFKEKQAWARTAIIFAFACWAIIDSIGCVQAGMYPQLYLINLFSIAVKALPIVFTWKSFSYKNRKCEC
jgi:hypothetical protein